MGNFKLVGLSTSVLLLALTGCNNDPPRLVDGGHDTPDTNIPPIDMGPPVDTGIVPVDMGHPGSTCTYGTGGCNLTDPSSCPNDASGARQGCYPDDGAPACYAAGTLTAGAACVHANDCDAGSVCIGTNVCARLCCANTDCATGETCNPLNDTTGTALPNHAGVCIRPTACTPVPESGCTGANHCYVTGSDGSTDCTPVGTVDESGTCDAANHCMSGLGCYQATGASSFTCYRYCRLGMGTASNPDCTGAGHTTCRAAGIGTAFGICDT